MTWHQQQAAKRDGYPLLNHVEYWSVLVTDRENDNFVSARLFYSEEEAMKCAEDTGGVVLPPRIRS